MPAQSDHVRRDAEARARAEIRLHLDRYGRRIYEEAKATISQRLAAHEGGAIDGDGLGQEAVETAIAGYLGDAEARPAIEGSSS